MKSKGFHSFHLPQTQQKQCINLNLLQLKMDADILDPKNSCDNGKAGGKNPENKTTTYTHKKKA